MDRETSVGLDENGEYAGAAQGDLRRSIALKLAAIGHTIEGELEAEAIRDATRDVLARYRELSRLLREHQCGVDRRVQAFLDDVLDGLSLNGATRLPPNPLILDRHGLARELSLPAEADSFHNDIIAS